MNVIRIRDPNALRPLHVVMLFLVGVTVVGGSLLLSAAESKRLVDGAVEWRVDSPLRALVQVLCLNYGFPTLHAGAVKEYILGVCAGLAILALSLAIAFRGRAGEEEAPEDDLAVPDAEVDRSARAEKIHIAPLAAAQVLFGLFLLWSFASSRWSAAPSLAIGGSIVLAIHLLWSFSLAHGLSPGAARIASRILIGAATVTSVVAVWYFYGRNPELRAKFPFGNPTFLAAALIPALLLAFTRGFAHVAGLIRGGHPRSLLGIGAAAASIAFCTWAFVLAGSRGPAVGVLFGLVAVLFFAFRGGRKWIAVCLGVALAVGGGSLFASTRDVASPTGRGETLRLREYAWGYAFAMYAEKPLTGHGQGGFVLAGDAHATQDALDDPMVFVARIAHAHNEWLEVLADLGSVGIVLLLSGLGLTFHAGAIALRLMSSPVHRWTLIGLLASLVALCVEETFGVGLRVSGVPTLFYSVIGLIWAMSARRGFALTRRLSATKVRCIGTGIVGAGVGLATLVLIHHDFSSALAAYQARQHLRAGEHEQAVQLTLRARSRLNPQRALANLSRLAEAHVLIAKRLQERAMEREGLARQDVASTARLGALIAMDRRASEEHCQAAGRALRELVTWSPGYLNHGWVACWLNLIKAANAYAAGASELSAQFTADAAASLLRELERQPYEPVITLQYLDLAGATLDFPVAIELLARPLRYHLLTPPFSDRLARMATVPDFLPRFEAVVRKAARTVSVEPPEGPNDVSEVPDDAAQAWAPEILRLEARLRFLRGDYQGARSALELAAEGYAGLAGAAPIGAAGCYAELAVCRFFADPSQPDAAIESARKALTLAPESLTGRNLSADVRDRLIDYHLAAGDEDEAKRLMQAVLPGGVTEAARQAALAVRYRDLCRVLLERRAAYILRKPPGDLLPTLDVWIQRSLELAPNDFAAGYLAADLAFHAGRCGDAASQLTSALEHGLPTDAALQFLEVALAKQPDCAPLAEIRSRLSPEHQPQPSEKAREPGGG